MKGSLRLQFFKWLCLYTIIISVTVSVMLAVMMYATITLNRIPYQSDTSRTLNELYYIFFYLSPVIIFLFLLASAWIISRRLTSPLSAMVRATQDIRRGNLEHRIEADLYDDEVRLLAETLNEAFDRYQDTFNRLERFSSNVSHQFKNPLAAIKTLGETALKQSRNAAEYEDTLGRMLEEANRLNRTVEQLLLLARISDENYRESMMSVDLSEHIVKMLMDFELACEVKDIVFGHEIMPNITIHGIVILIQEALLNLLDNAVRHTPEGGRIQVELKSVESGAILSVSDSGQGTSMAFSALLTQPKDMHSDGHGLGLAIVQDIVQLHRGSICCEQSVFGGASFVLRLPLEMID